MRTFKQIFIVIVTIVIFMVSSCVVYIYKNEDNLKEIIIEKLNQSLKSTINVGDIEFFVIKNFPFVSVELNDLYAIDAFKQDTLFEIELIQLKFNILNLYNRNYSIEEIFLRNGFASIYFKESIANYEIWRSTKDSIPQKNTDFGLENIKLENIKIIYRNEGIKSSFINKETQMQLKLKNGKTEINVDGEITNEKLALKNINYLASKNIKFIGNIIIDSLGYNIKSNLSLSDINFDLKIEKNDKNLNFNVNSNNADLQKIKELIPSNYISKLENYEFKGKSNFNLSYIDKYPNEAYIMIDFDLNQGLLKSRNMNFDMDAITLNGNYYNKNLKSEENSEIIISNFQIFEIWHERRVLRTIQIALTKCN